MPLQIVLAPVALAAAVASWPLAPLRPTAAASALAFLATTIPLGARALRSDRGIAWLVPAMLAVRSLAQAAGLAVGFTALLGDLLVRATRRGGDADGSPGPCLRRPGGAPDADR